jgi:hypothetical protein
MAKEDRAACTADFRQIVAEAWQEAVRRHKLPPGTLVERVIGDIMERLLKYGENNYVRVQGPSEDRRGEIRDEVDKRDGEGRQDDGGLDGMVDHDGGKYDLAELPEQAGREAGRRGGLRMEVPKLNLTNATFFAFRVGGSYKWGYQGRGRLTGDVFGVMTMKERREQILRDNGGCCPGMSTRADEYIIVAIGDEDVGWGWPLLLYPGEKP